MEPALPEFDFDSVVNRRGSHCYKWDGSQRLFGADALLPFWVADMDFATAPCILEALAARLQHPVLGYEERTEEYVETVQDWLQRRHGWRVPREWLVFCPPSTIVAMYGLLTMATSDACSIAVPTPTYGPLLAFVEQTGRRLLRIPMHEGAQRFELDLDRIAAGIEQDTEMLILCSPHNPTGRVFDEQELAGLVEIAAQHELILVSDEVHADLVRPGFRHRPLGTFDYAKSVTVISPNKAFNTAGLPQSSLVIPDAGLRNVLQRFLDTVQVNHDSSFGSVAMLAAYQDGEEWLNAVIRYIDANHRYLADYVEANIPQLRVWAAEATYLAWLDYRQTGFTEQEVQQRLVQRGGVALYNGSLFGDEGRGFLRMNIACPRATLERGLAGIRRALDDRLT